MAIPKASMQISWQISFSVSLDVQVDVHSLGKCFLVGLRLLCCTGFLNLRHFLSSMWLTDSDLLAKCPKSRELKPEITMCPET